MRRDNWASHCPGFNLDPRAFPPALSWVHQGQIHGHTRWPEEHIHRHSTNKAIGTKPWHLPRHPCRLHKFMLSTFMQTTSRATSRCVSACSQTHKTFKKHWLTAKCNDLRGTGQLRQSKWDIKLTKQHTGEVALDFTQSWIEFWAQEHCPSCLGVGSPRSHIHGTEELARRTHPHTQQEQGTSGANHMAPHQASMSTPQVHVEHLRANYQQCKIKVCSCRQRNT